MQVPFLVPFQISLSSGNSSIGRGRGAEILFLKALPPAWMFVPSLTFHAWSPKSSESQGAGPGAERDQAKLRAEKMGKRGEQPGTVEGQEQCQSGEYLRATEITGCVSQALGKQFFFFLQKSGKTKKKRNVKVAQSCPTLCDPMDYTVIEFSRPEYWSG